MKIIMQSLASLLKNNILFLAVILCYPQNEIWSHYIAPDFDTSPFYIRYLEKPKENENTPPSFFILNNEYNRGALDNRNTSTTTLYGESFFKEGLFTLNFNINYIYFDQKDRQDAARYGKPYLGGKLFPFLKTQANDDYFFFLEGRLGLPISAETSRFIDSNYYSAQGNIALGYKYNVFSFTGKVGGEIPISPNRPHDEHEDGVAYYLRPPEPILSYFIEDIQLKKSTNASGNIFYSITSEFSIFVGYTYKTPFYGVQKETSTGNKVPLIFREASIGLHYRITEKYLLTLSYRNPLYRGEDFRPYESSLQAAFSVNL
jgi:hypothetical protein